MKESHVFCRMHAKVTSIAEVPHKLDRRGDFMITLGDESHGKENVFNVRIPYWLWCGYKKHGYLKDKIKMNTVVTVSFELKNPDEILIRDND